VLIGEFEKRADGRQSVRVYALGHVVSVGRRPPTDFRSETPNTRSLWFRGEDCLLVHSYVVTEGGVDRRDVVRRGYDVVSRHYRADDAPAGQYGPWITRLQRRVPAGGRVLDVGCGCGVPVARDLTAAGYQVTGVDLSEVQIHRAERLVPAATLIRGDVTKLDWPAASFDAVVALYSIIHVPVAEQPRLLAAFGRWLVDGGVLLLTAGAEAWTGSERGWLGSDAAMWWDQADTATYRTWLTDAGFDVIDEHYVPEHHSGHSLFWVVRRATG
jgi:SAM-dependent methyltransferase